MLHLIYFFFFFCPTAEEDPLMWFQLGRLWARTDACPCCYSRYAVTTLLREEWHLSHFNSWSCLGQSWDLTEKLQLWAKLVFLSAYLFAPPQAWCANCYGTGGQLSKRGLRLYCRIRVCCGSGDWTRRAGPQRHTHHAAGTLDSLSKAPSVWHFFFSFPAVSSVWMVEHKSYFEGAHRWLWFGQSWQTLPAIADHQCCSPLHCGLQYGERRLEASQEWNWNINTGVAGYFPFFFYFALLQIAFRFSRTFSCAPEKKKQNKIKTSPQSRSFFKFKPRKEDCSRRGWSWGNRWQCVEGPYSVWLYSHSIWCWIESNMTLQGDRMAGTSPGWE